MPLANRTIAPAEETQLLDAIDRWVDREVKPIVKDHDHADKWPAETVEQMKELGLFGAIIGLATIAFVSIETFRPRK